MTTTSAVDAAAPDQSADESLEARFQAVRSASESIVSGLPVEDLVPQSMEDASPLKWHLAHTSWFFETFLLRQSLPDYRPLRDEYIYLFNSYYNAVGPQYSRPQRGMITRPTVADVLEYRAYVNQQMARLFDTVASDQIEAAVVLGMNHEQQHQELMLTDVKHLFAQNPLLPEFRPDSGTPSGAAATPLRWSGFPEGIYSVGSDGDGVRTSGAVGAGFVFDNEGPRHQVYLRAFELASRPVTNEEYLAFIDDGGYDRSSLWLSSGWSTAQSEGWQSPLYWNRRDGQWWQFTLGGERPLDLAAPVTHVSHYEADAYARWAGMRLPTEFEWEVAASDVPVAGNFADSGRWHPAAAEAGTDGSLRQMYGDVWEWTSSAYLPYPGFSADDDAIGEYNGKFMSSQMVLRGGSAATPDARHVRPTYRNFFPPSVRWQFSGIRLARDV